MRNIISIIFLALIPIIGQAKYRQTCEVHYKTNNSWSKKYTVEVTFMTGFELNQATNSFKYNSNSIYAIIFWDKNEASVIKISTILICGYETTKSCITNTYSALTGTDQDDDEWKICVTDFCY